MYEVSTDPVEPARSKFYFCQRFLHSAIGLTLVISNNLPDVLNDLSPVKTVDASFKYIFNLIVK